MIVSLRPPSSSAFSCAGVTSQLETARAFALMTNNNEATFQQIIGVVCWHRQLLKDFLPKLKKYA